MPKKVLIFSIAYRPFVGGAELAVENIVKRIPDIQFDIITLRFDKNLPIYEKDGNITIHRIGFAKRHPHMSDLVSFPLVLNKYFFPFTAFFKALFLHRKNHYDAIWSIMAAYAGFAALFFKIKYPRVPFLLTLQEGDPIEYIKKKVRIVYPLFRSIFLKADMVQAISTYLASFARDMGFKGKIDIVPNAVDVYHFSKSYQESELQSLKEKLGKKEGDRYLITTSRLVRKNAIDDVIRALHYLPSYVKFLILGTGSDEYMLKALAKDIGVSDRIIFFGETGHNDLPKYLHISDIFIRPSLSEGLGNSFLEAMAAGIPVIASCVGGIPDFLKDGETGVFCKIRDPKSIAEKVMIVLDDFSLRSRIILQAQKMVGEKYKWEIVVPNMKEVFERLMR